MRKLVLTFIILFICILPNLSMSYDLEYVASALWSDCYDIEIQDNYAYVLFTVGVKIFDISNPTGMKYVSEVFCEGSCEDIFLENNIAYIAAGWNGLYSIDISDPQNPKILDHCYADGYITKVEAHRSYLFANSIKKGIIIINAVNPSLLSILSYTGCELSSHDFCFDGKSLYLADISLKKINIDNPYKPFVEVKYNLGIYAQDILIVNDIAYIIASDVNNDVLKIVDISISTNPQILASYKGDVYGEHYLDLKIEGSKLFLLAQRRLIKLDYYDTNIITESKSYLKEWPQYIRNFCISKDYIYIPYITYSRSGAIDIISHNDFSVKDSIFFSDEPKRFDIESKVAYVTAGDSGLSRINLGQQGKLSIDKRYYFFNKDSSLSSANLVNLNDRFVFTCPHYGGLHILDKDTFRLHSIIDWTDYSKEIYFSPSDWIFYREYLYLTYVIDIKGKRNHCLGIFDLSDVSNPMLVDSSSIDNLSSSLYVINDTLFIAQNYGDLPRIYDISNPIKPILIDFKRFDDSLYQYYYLFEADDNIYLKAISDSLGKYSLFDFNDFENPIEIISFNFNEGKTRYRNQCIDNNLLYIVHGTPIRQYLEIYDISDTQNPKNIYSKYFYDFIWELKVEDNYLYFVNGDAFIVYKLVE